MNVLVRSASTLRRQWQESQILRWGGWAIAGILWLNVLWWHSDSLTERRDQAVALQVELGRLQGLQSGPRWEGRGEQAKAQLAVLQTMAWTESTPGLAQAAFQDFLTQSSASAGLIVKEIRVSTEAAGAARGATPGLASPPAGGSTEVRARLVAEYRPQTLTSWLSMLSSSPRMVMVDRLQLRQWLQPPQVEVDVRIVVRSVEAAR